MALNRTIQKIVQGIVQLAVRILLVVTLVFLVIRGLPVDPALAIAGPAPTRQRLNSSADNSV